MSITSKEYNGYSNRQTRSVAIWINNDKSTCNKLIEYVKRCKRNGQNPTYGGFIHRGSGLWDKKTGDGVSYTDHRVKCRELNSTLFEELI